MTRVKLCGMMRPEDIQAVNKIKPEYIGFVFAKKSRRYVSKEQAKVRKHGEELNKVWQSLRRYLQRDRKSVV